MSSGSIIAELRRKIRDVRYSQRAFGLSVSEEASVTITRAIAEITNGHLIITIFGDTSIPNLDISLTSPRYDSIGKLHQILSRTPGYLVQLDEDCNSEHSSLDLESFAPVDILGTGIDLKHHLFSDLELEEVIRDAVRRHNPTFTIISLPPQETPFVLQLAQANVCRLQALDASKRRGLDMDVTTLLDLSKSFEEAYKGDVVRLHRAIASPKESNSNLMGEGDIVLGQCFRKSLRTGNYSPMGLTLPPDAAVLLESSDQDIEDDNVRVCWQRNRNCNFYSYELWMDSRPEVIRVREGERTSSAKLAFRSLGANSNFCTVTFATFVEEYGQLASAFLVGDLEPITTYYFRLYVTNLGQETVASNTVAITTKASRCKFDETTAISVAIGPPGTIADVYFNAELGEFTSAHTLKIGEKVVTPTIITPYHIRVTFPNFLVKTTLKDLTVISPNGLIDNKSGLIRITAT